MPSPRSGATSRPRPSCPYRRRRASSPPRRSRRRWVAGPLPPALVPAARCGGPAWRTISSAESARWWACWSASRWWPAGSSPAAPVDDLALPQVGELLGRQAEQLAEHVLVVLAQAGAGQARLLGRLREREAARLVAEGAECWVRQRLPEAARGELRVAVQVGHGVHRGGGDARGLQQGHQLARRVLARPLGQARLDGVLVRLAAQHGRVGGVARPLGVAHGAAQRLPLGVAGDADSAPGVVAAAGEGALRRAVLGAVAGALG